MVSFIVETIDKASIDIVMTSLSGICGIGRYICEIIGCCVCVPGYICFGWGWNCSLT